MARPNRSEVIRPPEIPPAGTVCPPDVVMFAFKLREASKNRALGADESAWLNAYASMHPAAGVTSTEELYARRVVGQNQPALTPDGIKAEGERLDIILGYVFFHQQQIMLRYEQMAERDRQSYDGVAERFGLLIEKCTEGITRTMDTMVKSMEIMRDAMTHRAKAEADLVAIQQSGGMSEEQEMMQLAREFMQTVRDFREMQQPTSGKRPAVQEPKK